MTFAQDAAKARAAIIGTGQPTLALNPTSGVIHQWWCGLGPARAGAQFADKYVSVPAVVRWSIRPECFCKCLREGVQH